MRNFIVSDLHGNGKIYDAIMGYLNNLSKDSNDEITLYINGDLIDRGLSSASMLMDIKYRITYGIGNFNIKYIGGNHELLMYNALTYNDKNNLYNWFINGGKVTLDALKETLNKEDFNDLKKFISNLKVYHKFFERLDDKKIVLVHAECPNIVQNNCNITIGDDSDEVYNLVWSRKNNGNPDYYTIIGHTPVNKEEGYEYNFSINTLNIDGGNSKFVIGFNDFDHTPLIEIDNKNNRLIILTFNSKNEIICGNYFFEKRSIPINDTLMEHYRKYLNKEKNKRYFK